MKNYFRIKEGDRMKIKVKGFKSLIKAVRNRAHLFPVKVLIRAKSKTYYGIRYKTGNKAMEFTKKQMKIPNTVEVLFDTIDGKRKNITENDVLRRQASQEVYKNL